MPPMPQQQRYHERGCCGYFLDASKGYPVEHASPWFLNCIPFHSIQWRFQNFVVNVENPQENFSL